MESLQIKKLNLEVQHTTDYIKDLDTSKDHTGFVNSSIFTNTKFEGNTQAKNWINRSTISQDNRVLRLSKTYNNFKLNTVRSK